MNQLDQNIAMNLKRIRKSKNMILDALAEKTSVSKSMPGQIERGESNPTVVTSAKIADGLRIFLCTGTHKEIRSFERLFPYFFLYIIPKGC